MSKNQLAQTLLEMAGQKNVITVHRAFVNFAGSLEAGMLLSQLLYWTPRAKEGWIAKSDIEFTDELCLSRYALRRAREDLVTAGILETKLKRFNSAPVTHYHLKMDELQDNWIVWIRKIGLSEIEQSDCLESDNPLSGIEQSLTETTTETTTDITTEINISPPKNGGARSTSPEDERKHKTELALVKGIAKSIAGGRDLANWPEDVSAIVQVVCELWHLHPPTSSKSKAYWIASTRELSDASGEFGVAAIREMRADFERHMATHGGLPPFSVEGPNSLVKATRAKAGQMRGRGQEQDRSRYIGGAFAEFIEH